MGFFKKKKKEKRVENRYWVSYMCLDLMPTKYPVRFVRASC